MHDFGLDVALGDLLSQRPGIGLRSQGRVAANRVDETLKRPPSAHGPGDVGTARSRVASCRRTSRGSPRRQRCPRERGHPRKKHLVEIVPSAEVDQWRTVIPGALMSSIRRNEIPRCLGAVGSVRTRAKRASAVWAPDRPDLLPVQDVLVPVANGAGLEGRRGRSPRQARSSPAPRSPLPRESAAGDGRAARLFRGG